MSKNNYEDDNTEIYDPREDLNTNEFTSVDNDYYGEYNDYDYYAEPDVFSKTDEQLLEEALSYYTIENLPNEAYSNGWVAGEWYDKLLEHTKNLTLDNAELDRNSNALHQSAVELADRVNVLEAEKASEDAEREAAKARVENDRERLKEDREEFEDTKKKLKIVAIVTSILAAIGLLLAIFFGVKYYNELQNNQSTVGVSSVQEEQLVNMKENLDRAQQEKTDAESARQELESEVERLNGELTTSNDKLKSAESSLEESNRTLDEMTDRINEISNQSQETNTVTNTTTVTETVDNGGYTPPETITRTVEVTVPADNNDNAETTTTTDSAE